MIEQAPFRMIAPLEGLESVQDVSVGKNPVPLTITCVPTLPLAGLNDSLGPIVTLNSACAKS
ncbi:MAG: hypothetical protein ABSD49_05780, partial [Candidatus Bathyarchaeia archaeon]